MKSPEISVRNVLPQDREFIAALVNSAFGGEDETNVIRGLWRDGAATIEKLIAVDDEIAGYCVLSPMRGYPPLDGPSLGLGPVAIAPPHQRKGLGKMLIDDCLNTCNARNVQNIFVLGDPAYYSRFGFQPAARWNMSWAAADAGDAFQAIIHGKLSDSTEIARKIHYHPAFDTVG